MQRESDWCEHCAFRMRCCRASLLLCLTLLLHSGEAKVLTEAQSGPLYRVLGAPLSISCTVSGLASDNTQKEFEFRVTKPTQPTFEINIISTSDESFGYAIYNQRVASKEITLKHVSPNSVLFEIQSLQKGDEGDFECAVINTESAYDGTYNAKTIVKVIDNSLSVSSPVSTPLSYNEGDALTLTCQASSNTIQHTHLSLAWHLHKDGEDDARPIISLDRDFTLSPGPTFEGRYRAGLITLDKMGEATYRLHMARLELSDQGRIYCRAQEWIQDPDRSWYTITQKDAEETTLHVKAREVVPDTSSLVVRISTQQTTLQEGQELSLSCNVDAHNLEKRFLSVAWLRGSVELARIGPAGILSVGPEYSGREKGGELRATRIRDTDYRLRLQPVRTEDQGEYFCRAWLQDRGQDGAFTAGEAQTSSPQLVSISASESGLSVEMQHNVSVDEDDRLKLTCKVDGVKGQLSVTWERQSTSTTLFENIISLSQEGVMEIEGEFASRRVRAARPATDTFTLELDEVTPSDSGIYQCSVSEWKTNSKTHSQSKTSTVTVSPIESSVKLISRNTLVTVGENVKLMCRVQGPRVPTTLSWSLQHEDSTTDNILTLKWNGDISWSGDQHVYQLEVENKAMEVTHSLLINGASPREAGKYQCQASAFIQNAHKKPRPSNPVAVMVHYPVSKLSLTSSPTLTRNINSDIEIKCSVISEPFASSRYAVTWQHQQRGENKTIVSSDREALITFGTQVEPSDRQRISMRRSKGPSFELTIRQAQISDGGLYTCEVVEWLQEPRGNWYELPPESKITELNLIEPANDLQLEGKEQQLIAGEGDEVELKCNILSGAFSPSVFYKVAWIYTGHNSSMTNVPLVELDHMGLLRYPESGALRELQGRLRLARPTQSSFYLRIQTAHEGDSGTFQCQVEQYQLDREGHWQQKASETAGPISLTVNVAEKNLSIVKDELELNVSRSKDFTIPCHITDQSSGESEFQVTWFWQKEPGIQKRPIFVAYRNATLQDMLGTGHQLRFGHPVPNQFSLTVSKSAPENSGLYFCEVEEWLPSLSHGWRKVAVETSGYLTVNVFTEGEGAFEPQCKSGTWIGILVPLVICSLLVISLLVLKICRTNASGGKNSGESLWAESHPLNTKPSAED
ncbi:immunoglobulin superfamily member 3 isoform X1 [Hippoglossus stenolepis]|uniref:immunoglobulin superfamily member 3 isoform X1 n=1 Tax=Hippoglossus stenolepis TaxID=195615 RepID=UPI001FB04255|nr:immunoglobulin superfamily member 3 isoform X1 [Hippoglossus stenolepis]